MNNKTFLIIGPIPPPYHGVSVVTDMILNSALRDKFNLIHLDTSDRRSLSNIGKIDFTNVYLTIKHFLKFLWYCIKERPAIVYVPISQTTLGYLRDCFFLIPAKLFYRKVIIHLHGGYFRNFYEQSNGLMKILIRWTLKDVQRAIVLGESLRYIFKDLIPKKRITVVPNGLDGKIFDIYDTNRATKQKERYRILFLSTLVRSKGFIDVIKAIPEVIRYHSNDIEFVFAGELNNKWGGRDAAFEFIEQNKLHSIVKFRGVVTGNKKIRLLLSSDIFIFPTYYKYEGHPLVILEAMAAGLPVITTNMGAIKEAIIDRINGFIVEKQNPKQIAGKILLLLENEKLRQEMGRKSRERFLKYYTKDKFVENLSKVFEDVLAM